MKKIRVPRKKKKFWYKQKHLNYNFPIVTKLRKYLSYFDIEYGIKTYNKSAEELYWCFGRYSLDDVIWWHYVRMKHFGIQPQMSDKFQTYWDELKKIKVLI